MAQALLLALLTWAGWIEVWQLVFLSLFLGVVNTFDMTTRQAFLSEMVTRREELGNGIALNSSMVNGARLVGPTLAGLLLAQTSAAVCFLLNGLSYLAVLLALLAMRREGPPRRRAAEPMGQGLREGFRYVSGFAPVRTLLLLLGLSSMAGTSYTVLLPEFTVRRLGGEAHTLAFLTAASGLGLLSLATVATFTPALFVLFGVGFGMMVQMAASNTLLQTIAAEGKRGRGMSVYTLAFLGMAPLGSLLTGVLAARFGPPITLAVNGLLRLQALPSSR